MKSSFPRRVKHQSKNRRCDLNRRPCIGKELFINMYIYSHIHMCEKVFTKSTIFELDIGIASSFSGMAVNAFWKRTLQIYMCIYIYIYTYMCTSLYVIYILHYTLCIHRNTLYILLCAIYVLQYTLYILPDSLYIVH